MVVGILTCIGSFAAFIIPAGSFYNFIIWIISFLFGISLIMMGGTRVINEHEFYECIRNISKQIEKIKENNQ